VFAKQIPHPLGVGSFIMKYSQVPASPSSLSQTANEASLSLGNWTNDTTPTLNFTLTDPDADTLGYVISVDNNSDFSSPLVAYTYSANDLVSGTENSFTVGGAAAGGAYTAGAESQTLADAQYYWKIQAIDVNGLSSSEIIANSGGIAFGVESVDPISTTLGFGAIAVDSIITIVSGATDVLPGLHATPYYFENITKGTNSTYQAETSWSSTSLSANTQYSFRVKSKDVAGNESAYTAEQSKYTLANVPNLLSLTADSSTRIIAAWNANANSDGTEYYAENTTEGTNSSWTVSTSWISSDLSCSTEYSFRVKSRNGDGLETSFTDISSLKTQGCGVSLAPSSPPIISSNPQAPSVTISQSNGQPTLNFNVENAFQMAVSTTPDFKNVSWMPYIEKVILNVNSDTTKVYLKFRSKTGEQTSVIEQDLNIISNITPTTPNAPTLIRAEGDNKVYLVKNNVKQWIQTAEEFIAAGYKWSDVKVTSFVVIASYPEAIIEDKKIIIIINTPILRVRQSNTIESSILANVKEEENYIVLEEKDNWYKIQTAAGITGWISGDYATKQ